jgi:ribulose-5-phosphate 4-epimerase/fuculose-1-phosphate aldolase
VEKQFRDFEQRLFKSGLVEKGAPVFGFIDAEMTWSRSHVNRVVLETIFENLNINALLFSRPADPYGALVDYLACQSDGVIRPRDTETRTFLHDLPVARHFDAETLIPLLKKRKAVIIEGHGVITCGTVSLEQTFVNFSSVCFAAFVKFFADLLAAARKGQPQRAAADLYARVKKTLFIPPQFNHTLSGGPFKNPGEIISAMDRTGKKMVDDRLVDSFFGNISYSDNHTIFISQTGSSLDELRECIDPCPLDGSSCVAITASSELSAHMVIVNKTDNNVILHGHPKFSVILSMDCDRLGCEHEGECHTKCPYPRDIAGIPVVSGEVGTGSYGLCNTVPEAMITHPGVIVYGHGLFTAARFDFNAAFKTLLDIENLCRETYFKKIETF